MSDKIEIFTDGSCIGNPGPGGYSAIIYMNESKKILNGGYYLTTNNRMELMATIIALETLLKPYHVFLSTDSQYVRQGITSWIYNWKESHWKTVNKKTVKNIDLWKRLDNALSIHKIEWIWIKGHNGNINNEYCDILARQAANNPSFNDLGYSKIFNELTNN